MLGIFQSALAWTGAWAGALRRSVISHLDLPQP